MQIIREMLLLQFNVSYSFKCIWGKQDPPVFRFITMLLLYYLKKSENELKYGLIWFNLVFFLLLTNWDFLSRPLFFPGVREGGSGVFVKAYGT